MRDATRRSLIATAVASLVLGLGVAAFDLVPEVGAVPAVPPCEVAISATTVTVGTNVTIDVTGMTPDGAFTIVQTHNGTPANGSGTASATGTIHSSLPYALGSWTNEWTDTTSGAMCSVSWTVVSEDTTTTTTTTVPPAIEPIAAAPVAAPANFAG